MKCIRINIDMVNPASDNYCTSVCLRLKVSYFYIKNKNCRSGDQIAISHQGTGR